MHKLISFSKPFNNYLRCSCSLLFRLDWLQIEERKNKSFSPSCLLAAAGGLENYHRFNRNTFLCATLNTLRHFLKRVSEKGRKVGNFNYKHQHHVDGIINKYQHEVSNFFHRIFFGFSFRLPLKLFRAGNKGNFRLFSHVIYRKIKNPKERNFLPT